MNKPYTDQAYLDTSGLVDAVKIGVRTLDKLIDENYYRHPLKQQQEMSYNYRNIGLGVFGYATMLMKLGLKYGSKEALELTDDIFGLIFRAAVIESNELARNLGVFPKYKDCVWDSQIIKNHFRQDEIDNMMQYGLRNCSLISIAPNGSTATTLSESGGCEPHFSMKFTRRTVGMTDGEDTYFEVYCQAAQDYMKINKTDELPDYFISAPEVPWQDRIKTQAVMQKHVDTAISSTVNLPNSATKEDISMLYLMAWEEGLKGVTIFRDGCKRMPILSTKKNNEDAETTDLNSDLPRGYILEASDNLIGKKRKLQTGCGSLHVKAFFDPMTGDLMETFLSRGSTGGCANSYTGLSRMISLAARTGAGIDAIVDQLNSCGVCPSYAVRRATKHDTSPGASCPIAIGKALKEMQEEMYEEMYEDIKQQLEKNETIMFDPKGVITACPECEDVCPECGQPLIHSNGCIQCTNCAWSKCN